MGFSETVVTVGDTVVLSIEIAEAESITQASIHGRGRWDSGVATEWDKNGDIFTVVIPITPSLTAGGFRIRQLSFVGTDGSSYTVTNGAMSAQRLGTEGLSGGDFDCVNGWQGDWCVSYLFVGNGFEIVESDAVFIEVESIRMTPDRIAPGGVTTFEAEVAGLLVESMELKLELDGQTDNASALLEQSGSNDGRHGLHPLS